MIGAFASDEALNQRELGQFQLSIGTSLAIESLLNIHPDLTHPNIPVTDYAFLAVNLRTLFRNMYQSVVTEQRDVLSVEGLFQGLYDEIEQLEVLKKDLNHIDIYYYYSDYKFNPSEQAKLRQPRTIIQMAYKEKEDMVLKAMDDKDNPLLKKHENFFTFRNIVTSPKTGFTAILTHYCYDLLNNYSFSRLDLLESHTGRIKAKNEFYTKYFDGNKTYPLPLRFDLLQVLGDKETFSPMKKSLRDWFYLVAKEDKFSPTTTKDRIVASLEKRKTDEFALIMLDIMTNKKA